MRSLISIIAAAGLAFSVSGLSAKAMPEDWPAGYPPPQVLEMVGRINRVDLDKGIIVAGDRTYPLMDSASVNAPGNSYRRLAGLEAGEEYDLNNHAAKIKVEKI